MNHLSEIKFSDYIKKENRKGYKKSFPDTFNEIQKEFNKCEINVNLQNEELTIELLKSGNIFQSYTLNKYLDNILGPNIEKVHELIISHYQNDNIFRDELPLFIVRRHGSYSGEIGSVRRRRGWLVKFRNAWVVYADNFFPRHFFESTYFVNTFYGEEIKNLNENLEMPYSSGGGKFEKEHRIFPSLTHLSSNSNIYLSHLYDINKNDYLINKESVIAAGCMLGNNSDGKFGYGNIEDWRTGEGIKANKKYKYIDEELTNDELEFLKAYNIRLLSPFNYFPFPKNKFLKTTSLNGESIVVRKEVENYFSIKYNDTFSKFQIQGCIQPLV